MSRTSTRHNNNQIIMNKNSFTDNILLQKYVIENQEIKYSFQEVYETFCTNTNSLELDLPRLNVIFYLCNSLFDNEINVQIKNIQLYDFYMHLIKEKYINMNTLVFSYFCNQDIFGWVFYIISKLYSNFEDSEYNIVLLDHEKSEKLIKFSFSKDMIFYFLFGTFKLVKFDKKKNSSEKINNIDYYLTIHFELNQVPEYIHLHWIFTD